MLDAVALRAAYVLVFDGFADWEPASALAELRRTFGFAVRAIGFTSRTVESMGGLRVLPDLTLNQFQPESADILILPGGDFWMEGECKEISPLLQATAAAGRPVAGICAATLALAHAGLLDDSLHTSNGKDFIGKNVPKYRGQGLYRAVRALTDKNIITANGLAPFAFAAEIFRTLSPQSSKDISTYEALYARGLLDPDPAG